jgi:hypothetical protein
MQILELGLTMPNSNRNPFSLVMAAPGVPTVDVVEEFKVQITCLVARGEQEELHIRQSFP